jgi:hypothetical protein
MVGALRLVITVRKSTRDAVRVERGRRGLGRFPRWPRGDEVGGWQAIRAGTDGIPIAVVVRRRRRVHEVVAEGSSNERGVGVVYGEKCVPGGEGEGVLGLDVGTVNRQAPPRGSCGSIKL